MNYKEILEKVVRLAIKNGWTIGDWTDADDFEWHIQADEDDVPYLVYGGMGEEFYMGLGAMMLDHNFAKALWGSKPTYAIGFGKNKVQRYSWQHNLQQLVISEDPFMYLGDHLNG